MKSIKSFVFFGAVFCVSAFTVPRTEIAVENYVISEGYPYESHDVKTDDDYLLTVHRIPHGKNEEAGNTKKPVVFFMHGLFCSSNDWLMTGPERSLPYILADRGYDVWLGNARGNAYSRKHVKYHPDNDKEKFWDFSWHEIGYYDLAAKIDYILETTGQENLYYVGHSQGSTTYFVLTTTRPEYNNKIRLSTMLAPPVYMSNIKNKLLHWLSDHSGSLAWIANIIGLHEFSPGTGISRELGEEQCYAEAKSPERCSNLYYLITGYDYSPMRTEEHTSSGIATKQLVHYAQGITTGKFRHYDFGAIKNLLKYGHTSPPDYGIHQANAPIALYYSQNDDLADINDVKLLVKDLPNLANNYLVPNENFTHFDFLASEDVIPLLYDEVIKTIEKY